MSITSPESDQLPFPIIRKSLADLLCVAGSLVETGNLGYFHPHPGPWYPIKNSGI